MRIQKYLDNTIDLTNKTILVTGPTAGIGLAMVDHLLYKHAHVVMMARNKEKADRIINELLNKYPGSKIDFILYDQSKFSSIDLAIKEIKEKYSDFYALILNAGMMIPDKKIKTEQGYTLTMGTNFIGVHYFVKEITKDLKGQRRIIFQGSCTAANRVKKNIDIYSEKLSMWREYSVSKSGVEATFYHYYINNKDNNMMYLLCEPGIVGTDITRYYHPIIRFLGKYFLKVVTHKPPKGALTAIRCLQDDCNDGDYYVPRGIFTFMGYPKKKKFPKHRIREYLYNKLPR